MTTDTSLITVFRNEAVTDRQIDELIGIVKGVLADYLISKGWIYERVGAEGYKAYRDRLQALDLKYNVFGYDSKTTGERKARQQVRITHKGLTKLAAMIASDAVTKRMAAAAGQNQQRLPLPEDDG